MESISLRELIDYEMIKKHGLIVFVGAGVSKNPPSRVPTWFSLNGMILDALKQRVTNYLGRDKIWLDQVIDGVIGRRDAQRFPPEYQALIMEEQCGKNYFQALSAVDVNQVNEAHPAIAALGRSGILKAVVTTNFDRLIEKAFEAEKVPYQSFFDEKGFRYLLDDEKIISNNIPAIPILKIHGSVESITSIIDTLQQRMGDRQKFLDEFMLKWLGSHFVLYIGFSAGDLNHNPDYLGLRKSAEYSPGALFIQYPGSNLEPGAEILLEAYGTRCHRIEATLDDFFLELLPSLNLVHPDKPVIIDANPEMTVASRLKEWAESLQPYEAINVLTALFDGGGEENAAFEVLHKTWKYRSMADSKGEHYARYQYNYANHCLQSGEMQYEETPQNFLRSQDVVPQSYAGFALWNLYRARVDYFWPFMMKAESHTLDPRVEGDHMLVIAKYAVIYRKIELLKDLIEAGNRQLKFGDVPRAVKLLTTAARLAARSKDSGLAFDLFDHCERWINYLGDDTSYAELYLAQGIANFEMISIGMGSIDSAGWNYAKALPVLRKNQCWPSLIEGLIEGFRYYVAVGKVNDSSILLKEAGERIMKGYEIYYPHLGIAVAEYHLRVQQWERAKRELLNCRPYAEESKNEWAISTINAYNKQIEQEMGNMLR